MGAPRTIGAYRLRRRLGAGHFGEVWAAFHSGLDREAAVRVLSSERLPGPARARDLDRIMATVAALSHPAAVRIYDHGREDDGRWYLGMEWLGGQTLAARVAGRAHLVLPSALRIICRAAEAVGEAHGRSLAHGALAPSRILLGNDEGGGAGVKVLGQGLGAALGPNLAGARTPHGWVGGSPACMAPEVAAGAIPDARSDVYSLGAVLYFALTAWPVFAHANVVGLRFAHAHLTPRSPRELRADVPPSVERLVAACLEKRPSARPQNGEELAAALAECGARDDEVPWTWSAERPSR